MNYWTCGPCLSEMHEGCEAWKIAHLLDLEKTEA